MSRPQGIPAYSSPPAQCYPSFSILCPFLYCRAFNKGQDTKFPLLQGFPTAHRSLPYSSLPIHLPVFIDFPLSESKQAIAFAIYNNEREQGKGVHEYL
jgi:hypothetical protein